MKWKMTKNFKRNLIYALLFIWAIGLPAFLVVYSMLETPQAITLPMHEYTLEWKAGDEIIPYPPMEIGKYNCTDATLYSYLFIEANPRDYKTKIIMGKDPYSGILHVWLLVSDNGTRYVYDWGLPIAEGTDLFGKFIGREITYKQLLWYAKQDK